MNIPFGITVLFGLMSIGQFIYAHKMESVKEANGGLLFAMISALSAIFIL